MHDHTAAVVWADPAALATTLFALGVDRYGPEARHWQPETWLRDVYDDCRVKLPGGNLDRLMAACSLFPNPDVHADDRDFYSRESDFEFLCRMFNSAPGGRVHYGELADAEDVTWGVAEAVVLRPVDHDFSPAVKAYAALACRHDGLADAPRVLKALGVVGALEPPAGHDPADPDHALLARARSAALARVEAAVAANARTLAAQLAALPLRAGSAGDYARRVARLAGR